MINPVRTGAAIFGCAGLRLTPDEKRFFTEADPWGFILFARNVENPDQIRSLTSELRDTVGRDAPVLIDQEGGRVHRLGPPHWRDWPPPLDEAEAAGADAERALYLRYRIIAEELRAVGVDVNCAPCADVAGPETHPFLRNRCYGTEPARVAGLSRAVATGLLSGGVLPVLKHIPGHGRGTADSHLNLPVVDAGPDDLAERDFAPFKAVSDLPLAMTAHVLYTAYDADAPATTSPRLIRLIREEIGFDGLLMTDDLSMEALGGSMTSRTRASLSAGCDIILHCNGDMDEMREIALEAGRLSEQAAKRAARALALRGRVQPIDIQAAVEERLRLVGTTRDRT